MNLTPEQAHSEIDPLKELRSEVNLLIFPFFALNNRDSKARLESQFKTTIKRNGSRLEMVWNVSANQKYGYPGPFAKRVHKAIEQIINEMEIPIENPIKFSTYEICKRAGESIGGRQYQRVKKALFSIKATTVHSKGAYYCKGRERWIDDVFSLYDRIIFKGEKLKDGTIAESNYLFLNDFYLENINTRYIKPLDFPYYKSLETNVARRLYELLGVKFFGIFNTDQKFIRYKYSTLCQLLPLKRQEYFSYAKRQFNKAHKELENTNFFSSVKWDEVESDDKDWLIYYFPGPRAKEEIKENLSNVPKIEKSRVALTEPEKAEVSVWVSELSEKLKDEEEKNTAFYKKLAIKIIKGELSETMVRRCISETQSEDQMRQRDSEATPIENRSAYFTNLLKRRLKEKDKDLNELL